MHEEAQTPDPLPPSAGEAATTRAEGSPTPEERRALIRAYQAQAMGQSDLLLANLEVLNGDLMLLALQNQEMGAGVVDQPAHPAERGRGLRDHTEMHLRIVRQIDRLAQIARRAGKAPPGENRPGRAPGAGPRGVGPGE